MANDWLNKIYMLIKLSLIIVYPSFVCCLLCMPRRNINNKMLVQHTRTTFLAVVVVRWKHFSSSKIKRKQYIHDPRIHRNSARTLMTFIQNVCNRFLLLISMNTERREIIFFLYLSNRKIIASHAKANDGKKCFGFSEQSEIVIERTRKDSSVHRVVSEEHQNEIDCL